MMNSITQKDLQHLYLPPADSHKGQNGRLLIIGGSELFHAASLWALQVASRMVDLVHYCSVPENNELVKKEFRNGIVVARDDVEAYIEEDDCILIGPGMTRDSETENLTNRLLKKYPHKQWVIDAGALQMGEPGLFPKNAILTPHKGEYDLLCQKLNLSTPQEISQKTSCIVLVKGQIDEAYSQTERKQIEGGNAGMTKGGTGDVLAGLIAALACKNDPWLATLAGSFINKKAGDELYKTVGPFFNASDLADQIPKTMKGLLDL